MKSRRVIFLVLFVAAAMAGVVGKAVAERPGPAPDVAILTAEVQAAPEAAAPEGEGVDPYLEMSPVAHPVKCDDLCRARIDCSSTANDGRQCGTRINPQTGREQKCFCALCPAGRNCWH